VQGDADSERYLALITQQADARGGDVGAGIAAAAGWIGERLPLSSLNADRLAAAKATAVLLRRLP
jgi:glutamine amidotransferase